MSDLIDRQAAIDVIENYPHGNVWNVESMEEMVDKIKALTYAQPERAEGEWIPVTNGRGGHECNKCHEYAPSYQNGDEHLTKFCPYCGTKMK